MTNCYVIRNNCVISVYIKYKEKYKIIFQYDQFLRQLKIYLKKLIPPINITVFMNYFKLNAVEIIPLISQSYKHNVDIVM